MNSPKTLLLALCFFLFSVGCSVITTPYAGSDDKTLQPTKNSFSYKKAVPYALVEISGERTENYEIFELTLLHETALRAKYFRSRIPGKKRTVIVLPLYGENEVPARWFADYITVMNLRADFNVIYVQEAPGDDPLDLDAFVFLKTEEEFMAAGHDTTKKFKKAVLWVRRIIDWTVTEVAIDPNRIGIVGLSTSALVASVAMAVDSRISAGAIFLGGGHINEMMAQGSEQRISQIRENFIRSTGKSAEELSGIFKIIWEEIEPVNYVSVINPSRLLYFDSANDEYIPKAGRDAFWEAAGKPERITFLHRHKWSFLSLSPLWFYYTDQKIADFFRKKL